MSVLYLLIPLGLVLLALGLWAFFWAVRAGQFDDLDSPGVQILLDDDRAPPPAGTTDAAMGRQLPAIDQRPRDA